MPTLNLAIRNSILDALFNAGSALAIFDNGTAEFRTGAAPGPDNAATGTLVAGVALGADSMTAAAAGSVAKNATWQDLSADNAGTIGHARFKSSDGLKVMEFTVTNTGGGGEIIGTVSQEAPLFGAIARRPRLAGSVAGWARLDGEVATLERYAGHLSTYPEPSDDP